MCIDFGSDKFRARSPQAQAPLPTDPPFTARFRNLPYELTEDTVKENLDDVSQGFSFKCNILVIGYNYSNIIIVR